MNATDSKITPGPWAVAIHDDAPVVLTDTERPWVIADIRAFETSKEDDGLANARAIAAVPDMIAALKAIVQWHDEAEKHGQKVGPDIDEAKAALAKARGE